MVEPIDKKQELHYYIAKGKDRGKGEELRLLLQPVYQPWCVCVCVCVYIYSMVN